MIDPQLRIYAFWLNRGSICQHHKECVTVCMLVHSKVDHLSSTDSWSFRSNNNLLLDYMCSFFNFILYFRIQE